MTQGPRPHALRRLGHGAVTVLRGTASGLTATNAKSFTARDVSLKGDADFGWAFGR